MNRKFVSPALALLAAFTAVAPAVAHEIEPKGRSVTVSATFPHSSSWPVSMGISSDATLSDLLREAKEQHDALNRELASKVIAATPEEACEIVREIAHTETEFWNGKRGPFDDDGQPVCFAGDSGKGIPIGQREDYPKEKAFKKARRAFIEAVKKAAEATFTPRSVTVPDDIKPFIK